MIIISTNQATKNRKFKKYSQATLLSSTALTLTACNFPGDDSVPPIYGTSGDDILIGTSQPDSFISSAGADVIDGKGNIDGISYKNSPAAIQIDLLGGVGLGGYAEGDTLINIERLTGSNFDDILTGSDNNDRIGGGAGADILDGKDGIDLLSYAGSKSGIEINLITGLASGGDAEGDTIMNFENIDGSSFDDVIVGNENSNRIFGRSGVDNIYGNGGDDYLQAGDGSTIYGGDGNDDILAHRDIIIYGGMGEDTAHFQGQIELELEVLKADGNIIINATLSGINYSTSNILNSVEWYFSSAQGLDSILVDIKTVWSDLAAVEQTKFVDEVEFLSWLGDDTGYNYEGL